MAGSVGKARAALRSSPKRYSGTDPPLSLAGPTLADLQRTAELEKVVLCLCLRFAALTAYLASIVTTFRLFCWKTGFQFLVEAGLYEGKEESAKREDVLSEIGQVIPRFLFTRCLHVCLPYPTSWHLILDWSCGLNLRREHVIYTTTFLEVVSHFSFILSQTSWALTKFIYRKMHRHLQHQTIFIYIKPWINVDSVFIWYSVC